MDQKNRNNIQERKFHAFFSDQLTLWVSCISIIVLFTCYFVFFDKSDLSFFPGSEDLQVDFYNDSVDGGTSVVENCLFSDSIIHLDFVLNKGFVRPYVGINLYPNQSRLVDISDYNQIQIEIEGTKVDNLVLYLITKQYAQLISGVKYENLFLSNSFELSEEKELFSLDFKDFEIPDWWFDVNNLSPLNDYSSNWENLVRINIATGLTPSLGDNRSLQVKSIVFVRDNTFVIAIMGLLQLLVELFLVFWFLYRNRSEKNHSHVVVNYKAVTVEDEKNVSSDFLEFINNNFQDSNLSLEKIAKSTGIQPRAITEHIAEKFDCNFKTYINQIRINEAKRLLNETDLYISEIAYKVGFSSPSSFNRVFKSLTGRSPSSYLNHT